METRQIGSLSVSVVGLGCNNFGGRLDAERTAATVHAALDAGITFFDTADIYGKTRSEEFLGRALGRRRNDIVLATKFGMQVDEQRTGAKPAYVRQAVEDSLRRLGTDCIDLYQLHQPDPTTPIADTLGALDELVRAGKVREIGCSNFSASELRTAREAARPGAARFVSVQNEYSLLQRDPERDVLDECKRAGLAFIPYFPLASGLLTGKYRHGQSPPPRKPASVSIRHGTVYGGEPAPGGIAARFCDFARTYAGRTGRLMVGFTSDRRLDHCRRDLARASQNQCDRRRLALDRHRAC